MRPLYAFPKGEALSEDERRTLEAIRQQLPDRVESRRTRAARTLLEFERIRRSRDEARPQSALAALAGDLEAALRLADALLALGSLERISAALKVLLEARGPAREEPPSLLWHLLVGKALLFLGLPRTSLRALKAGLDLAAALPTDSSEDAGGRLDETLAGLPLLAASLAARYGRMSLADEAAEEAARLLPETTELAADPDAEKSRARFERWRRSLLPNAPLITTVGLALEVELDADAPAPATQAAARRRERLLSMEVDRNQLAALQEKLALTNWEPSHPLGPLFCRARTCALGASWEVMLRMNEAAASHLPPPAVDSLLKALPEKLSALGIALSAVAALHIRQDFIVGVELEQSAAAADAPSIRWLDFRMLPGAAAQRATPDEPAQRSALGLPSREADEADLFKRVAVLNYQKRYRSIIALLESLPAERLTPPLLGELARAYNNAAKPGEDRMFRRAIELLQTAAEADPNEADRYLWNYRMGFALCRLDRDGEALNFFERALAARPGDRDAEVMSDVCMRGITMPVFTHSFPERAAAVWARFEEASAQLLALVAEGRKGQAGARIQMILQNVGSDWLAEVDDAAEDKAVGPDAGKSAPRRPSLILSPDGRRSQIFPLLFFAALMPEALKAHWRLVLGLPMAKPLSKASFGAVRAEELSVWMTPNEDGWKAVLYAESLRALSPEEASALFPSISELLSRAIGEAACMRWIRGIAVIKQPLDEPAMRLAELPKWLQEKDPDFEKLTLEALARMRIDYWLKPSPNPNADLRFDAGRAWTLCPGLINGYRGGAADDADLLQRQGAFAGFFAIEPAAPLSGEAREKEMTDLLCGLEGALEGIHAPAADEPEASDPAGTLLFGQAWGERFAYADYFFWTLHPALQAALNWARDEPRVKSLRFHSFRRQAGTVLLKAAPISSDGSTLA